MNTRMPLLASIILILVPVSFVSAGPLTEAHVTKIVNQVKLVDPTAGDRYAKLDDVVHGDLALTTGIKSRSELLFQDNTLTRLGPESYFSFKSGTRDMTLQKGTMLLQVPKGLGGAKIHTASVTAAITGTTIMMEYVPEKEIKVLVLEGTLRLSMNGRFGDSLLLTPGKMVIMPPNARRIPDPVTVDLKKVVQTSTLVNMHTKKGKQANADNVPLPSMSKIETEVVRQQSGKDAHHLVDTNLVIVGKGTNVVIGSDELIADLTARTNVAKTNAISAAPAPAPVTPGPTPNPAPTPNSNPPPTGTPPPPPPGVYVTDNTTTIATQVSSAAITTQGATYSGVIYNDLATNGSPSGFLFAGPSSFDNKFDFDNFYLHQFSHSAVFVFDSLQLGGGIAFNLTGANNNVALVGNNGITNSAATINLNGVKDILFATMSGDITLDSGISFTTNDPAKPNFVQFYARGGDLNIGSTFTLANSTLQFAAENNAILSGGTITAKNLEVIGLLTVQFDDNANVSDAFQLNGGDVEIGGTVAGRHGFLYGNSATINGTYTGESLTANVSGNFILNGGISLNIGNRKFQVTAGGTATINGTVLGNVTINANDMVFATDMTIGPTFKGELTATGGDIDATGHTLSGFDQISATGNFTAAGVTANKFTIGGTLTSPSVSAFNAGTIVANALHADTVTANNSVTVNSADLAPLATNTLSITAPTISLPGGAALNGQNGTPLVSPANAFNLTLSTNNFTLNSPLSLNGGDGDISVTDAGGNGGQLDITGNNLTINAPISATTGLNSNSGMTGGIGGTVNLTAQNTITLNNKIEVSSNDGNRRSSASGGHINIKSNATGGTAINVTSSAQLLALLNAAAPGPGGSIKFTSAGGAINVSGTAQADRGTIEITNNGTAAGNINLTNATLAADTIKVGALATNGTLNIGGGTISADTLIKLYAGGSSGTVDFVDNVTLSGNSAKIIAADTVIINNGKIVTILGPTAADVFTNHPHYTGFGGDATTTGTFGGKGAATHPLSGAPGY